MALKLLTKKNYLSMISNSVKGPSYLFRNLFAERDGQVIDIAEDGHNSCAIFVSHILYHFKLLKDLRATVDSLQKDLELSGWVSVAKPLREGDVLIWESKLGYDKKEHRHIGFYIGHNEAVSNDSRDTGFPWRHHYTYDESRKIDKIYRHPSFDE